MKVSLPTNSPTGVHPTTTPTSNPLPDTSHHDHLDNSKEYTVRFVIRLKTENSLTEAATAHLNCINAIRNTQPEITIFDNYGALFSKTKYEGVPSIKTHFHFHLLPGNETLRRRPVAMVVHRIYSQQAFRHIRQQISSILHDNKTRMHEHLWTEDDAHITNIGFHIGLDPRNYPKDVIEHAVRQKIKNEIGTPLHKIPKFQCGFIRPCYIDKHGNTTKTTSYDIQCRSKDAQTLISLLARAMDSQFCFHKTRHTSPSNYSFSIDQQNNFLKECRIIPIEGISPDTMSLVKKELLKIDGLDDIVPHKHTSLKGRWNLITTKANFESATILVETHLPLLKQQYSFSTGHLAFKNLPRFYRKPAPTPTIDLDRSSPSPAALALERNSPSPSLSFDNYDDSQLSFTTDLSPPSLSLLDMFPDSQADQVHQAAQSLASKLHHAMLHQKLSDGIMGPQDFKDMIMQCVNTLIDISCTAPLA